VSLSQPRESHVINKQSGVEDSQYGIDFCTRSRDYACIEGLHGLQRRSKHTANIILTVSGNNSFCVVRIEPRKL